MIVCLKIHTAAEDESVIQSFMLRPVHLSFELVKPKVDEWTL